jgi:hypothetical protein
MPIFSDACIKAHAAQALKLLKESNASKSNNTVVVLGWTTSSRISYLTDHKI